MYRLHVIPALKDNYIWLLENNDKQIVIIDPGEAAPVISYLKKHHLSPLAILLTHHHIDHTGGVTELKAFYPDIEVYGPSEINLQINYLDNIDKISIADFQFDIISVPGHTLGHLAYYCRPYLFCGDTLMSAGCGRIFEGDYKQMLSSLNNLKRLPDDTLICTGHEYTKANLNFAQMMVPHDKVIHEYYNYICKKKITLPSILTKEKQINLFLRCKEKSLQNKFNCNNELELFAFFRSQKDIF
ncbi:MULTISPECIES: hydroxyacylglutathione hydrolase [unclassified Gilliamella]|uniref:hydroxyacylglutathione hydrolase n=1 Tax=unclassified Gilliamella TaxID=2685620 RepID=UPI002269D4E8|nr:MULTISPECIES: hydroxyacylglutathione hydrolase [unclassified Gilliamella]MCX8662466.1 hydroxyacylglutathione hydrolase [Gilliamella sp. B2911]MCX8675669.1 hydroxyacylglutathione hydrolase [Gilliamella sp. B3023]